MGPSCRAGPRDCESQYDNTPWVLPPSSQLWEACGSPGVAMPTKMFDTVNDSEHFIWWAQGRSSLQDAFVSPLVSAAATVIQLKFVARRGPSEVEGRMWLRWFHWIGSGFGFLAAIVAMSGRKKQEDESLQCNSLGEEADVGEVCKCVHLKLALFDWLSLVWGRGWSWGTW